MVMNEGGKKERARVGSVCGRAHQSCYANLNQPSFSCLLIGSIHLKPSFFFFFSFPFRFFLIFDFLPRYYLFPLYFIIIKTNKKAQCSRYCLHKDHQDYQVYFNHIHSSGHFFFFFFKKIKMIYWISMYNLTKKRSGISMGRKLYKVSYNHLLLTNYIILIESDI